MSLSESTFAVASTTKTPQGKEWVLVLARNSNDAIEKAKKHIPDPYEARAVPIDHVKRTLHHINTHGLGWIACCFIFILLSSVHLFVDESGEAHRPFIAAVGLSLLWLAALFVLFIIYCHALDMIARRLLDKSPLQQHIFYTIELMEKKIWRTVKLSFFLFIGIISAISLLAIMYGVLR